MKIPRPFQQEAIDYGKDHNLYICDDCGLGKTLEAIEIVKAMGQEHRKILVVCPKASRVQWELAITEQVPDAQVIQTNHLKYKFNEINAWFITTYDELTPRSILYYVAQIVWSAVIIDEAHRLRNHQTQKAKNITKLWAARKIALSATPVEQHGGQLWSILQWLDHEEFGDSYWKWVKKTFESTLKYFGGVDIGAPKDFIKYQAQVMPYIIRRTKAMVAPDLPKKIEIPVYLQMEQDQKEVYNEVASAKDVLVNVHERELLITNALTLFTRLHQISVHPSLIGLDKVSSIKMEWLEEWLDDHKDLKVLIFSRYTGVIERIQAKYNCAVVMRGINQSERFKTTDERILAGTIDSMSESLSLGMADAAIFLDQMWSATRMQQAVDRIHRLDITTPKLIYNLIASKEDAKVMEAYTTKMTENDMLFSWLES